jgi:phenylalanyl-tRNA synthetase beta chain
LISQSRGLGDVYKRQHEGIMILDASIPVGTAVSTLFDFYEDWIYEIGLTPNRMDAMSHYGVAKDVCAYLSYHEAPVSAVSPFTKTLNADSSIPNFSVNIEDHKACARYAGVVIEGVQVKASPAWLKNKLISIGLRSINNIVDITNYILHETGQPLHAFDAAAIKDQKIVVKKYPAGTSFLSLDGTERKLAATDLMISDSEKPLCIAGVFGGLNSGVKDATSSIFLESAWFDNVSIRKTSVHHGLRTDAATRFEKGVDIENTVKVLERAALMIQEIAGGKIGQVVDVYPHPATKKTVVLPLAYLKKLSGKQYPIDKVITILNSLGFVLLNQTADTIEVAVPYHKPDISLPADIVEEVLRIDGLDNIAIPSVITMSPSIDPLEQKEKFKDKIAQYLVGRGFTEILTNSITNSKYFSEESLQHAVTMLNNLSADLDVMRPSMLETGLEAVAYNINRRNHQISFFEIGKVYSKSAAGKYQEGEQLAIYLSGKQHEDGWRQKGVVQDFFVAKGIAEAVLNSIGVDAIEYQTKGQTIRILYKQTVLGLIEVVNAKKLQAFDIKQSVLYIQFDLAALLAYYQNHKVVYQEVSKYPSVERDLALVLPTTTTYEAIDSCIKAAKLNALSSTRVFDVFESDKLGHQKKSVAINFVFNAADKTLTDVEIDTMMKKLVGELEKNIQAEIRK